MYARLWFHCWDRVHDVIIACVANLVQPVLLLDSARERVIKVHSDSGDKEWQSVASLSSNADILWKRHRLIFLFWERHLIAKSVILASCLCRGQLGLCFGRIYSNNHGKITRQKESVKLYLTALFQSWQVPPCPAGLRPLSGVIWERTIDPASAHLT